MRKFEIQEANGEVGCYSDITIIEKHSDDIGSECIADVWTTVADAKLMAAAPELLEQLKELVAVIDTIPCSNQITREAKRLIAEFEEI